MQDILFNNFKKELIVYGVRPDIGAKALICKTAKDCLALGKKVLFYSFELPEEITLKRINADDETNLLVKSGPLKELSEIISLETGIPLTKPGLHHRFNKIKSLAQKIREKEETND